MLIRIMIIFLIFLNILPALAYPTRSSRPYDNNWYIRVDFNTYANADRKMFDPPAVGQKPKRLNKIQRILLSADRKHPSLYYQYEPHVTNREYSDCSKFIYVDCSNYAFCRCWQCRDYVYPFRERGID